MEKRYVCFVCYKYHPEMKGVSQKEFNSGNNTCTQEKCTRKGKSLEEALYCEKCSTLFPAANNHAHAGK